MRIQRVYYWFTALCAVVTASVDAQGTVGNGTFQDLDFESAVIVPVAGKPGYVEEDSAMPGWTVTIGGVPQSDIPYPGLTLGQLDQSAAVLLGAPKALDGNYSFAMQGGPFPSYPSVSLQQTGMVPNGANSLTFRSYAGIPTSIMSMTINGSPVSYTSFGDPANGVYVVSISQFAGETMTIAFGTQWGGVGLVDNITFSSQQVPEPSTLATAAIGLATLILVKRRRSMMRKIIEEN